jgi:hypothetical protein
MQAALSMYPRYERPEIGTAKGLIKAMVKIIYRFPLISNFSLGWLHDEIRICGFGSGSNGN